MTSRRFQKVLYGATRVGALAAIAACADRTPMGPSLSPESGPSLATAPTTGQYAVSVANLGGVTQYPLYAGGGSDSKGTLVGYVLVTSSAATVGGPRTFTVTYQANAGYCFEEAHLAITGGEASQFQGKNGNPAPGQFPYKSDPAGCESTITFSNLGPFTLTGNAFVIAAHSVVSQVGTPGYAGGNFVSGGSLAVNVSGWRPGNLPGFIPQNQPAVPAWEPGADVDPSFWDTGISWQPDGAWLLSNGADWVWRTYRTAEPVVGEVVRMEASINVPVATTGTLRITCDNGYAIYQGATKIAGGDGPTALLGTQLSDGFATLAGLTGNTNLMQGNVSGDGWQSTEAYPVSLAAGANTFTIYGVNEYRAPGDVYPGFPSGPAARAGGVEPNLGTIDNNPAGCIFGIQANGVPGVPGGGTETAWGANSSFTGTYGEPGNFGGSNWATYIFYRVQ
jgi:hypothetical protein